MAIFLNVLHFKNFEFVKALNLFIVSTPQVENFEMIDNYDDFAYFSDIAGNGGGGNLKTSHLMQKHPIIGIKAMDFMTEILKNILQDSDLIDKDMLYTDVFKPMLADFDTFNVFIEKVVHDFEPDACFEKLAQVMTHYLVVQKGEEQWDNDNKHLVENVPNDLLFDVFKWCLCGNYRVVFLECHVLGEIHVFGSKSDFLSRFWVKKG